MNKEYSVNGISLVGIRNHYELEVINKMIEILPQYPDFDGCSMCIEDVYSLCLSRIPAVYTHPGSVILHPVLSKKEIEEVVRSSISRIMEHPKHR